MNESQDKDNYQSDDKMLLTKKNEHVHVMKLKEPWFGLVAAELKDVEIRVFDAKRRLINVGDSIMFRSPETNHSIVRKVMEILEFENFQEALENVGISRALPGKVSNVEKGVAVYHGIEGYRERASMLGVVAFVLGKC